MAETCVHKGCNKAYTDPDEVCTYHPGPPVFHEGQKGMCTVPVVVALIVAAAVVLVLRRPRATQDGSAASPAS